MAKASASYREELQSNIVKCGAETCGHLSSLQNIWGRQSVVHDIHKFWIPLESWHLVSLLPSGNSIFFHLKKLFLPFWSHGLNGVDLISPPQRLVWRGTNPCRQREYPLSPIGVDPGRSTQDTHWVLSSSFPGFFSFTITRRHLFPVWSRRTWAFIILASWRSHNIKWSHKVSDFSHPWGISLHCLYALR